MRQESRGGLGELRASMDGSNNRDRGSPTLLRMSPVVPTGSFGGEDAEDMRQGVSTSPPGEA